MFQDDACCSLRLDGNRRSHAPPVSSQGVQTDGSEAQQPQAQQTGAQTLMGEKPVKQKDETASLLAYCKGRLKKLEDEVWLQLLEQGAVTVGK